MSEVRLWLSLTRQLLILWRSGQLRFRLETFGLYYPALPYRRPWWRISPTAAWLLVRRTRAYGRWLIDMNGLRQNGPADWWARHR